MLVPQAVIHVTNVENTPDGDRQSSAKDKMGVKMRITPGNLKIKVKCCAG